MKRPAAWIVVAFLVGYVGRAVVELRRDVAQAASTDVQRLDVTSGKIKLTNCYAVKVDPVVKNDDGSPPTDEQLGLALLQSLRNARNALGETGSITLARKWGRQCEHAWPIWIEVNGEKLLSIEQERK